MLSILEKQKKLEQDFTKLSSWEDRYKKIIEMGKAMPAMPEDQKVDMNKVSGCQSQVWLVAELKNDLLFFHADSDASITKGLISLLIYAYSGHSVKEILSTPPEFIFNLGLNTNLSQSRSNGLASMMKQIKLYALAFSLKTSGSTP